jgi:predicted porin
MKKQILALVTLCLLAGTAHAQSRVTLYGLIDKGFEALSNVPVTGKTVGGRQYRLDATFGLTDPRGGFERHRGSGRWSGSGIHTRGRL